MTENIAIAIEREYNDYKSLSKVDLAATWKRFNRVSSLKISEVSKDQLITDILTFRFGKAKMDIWREYIN